MTALLSTFRSLITKTIFIFCSVIVSFVEANEFKLATAGQYTQEGYFSKAIHTLNDAVPFDDIWYIRTTLDLSIDGMWGDGEISRIHFYDMVRFRLIWGNSPETRSFNSSLGLSNVFFTIPGGPFNKHVVWTKEAWLKFFLDDKCRKDYVQIGLIPYEVGRGISLGVAYDASGYLGFQSDFSIDQFAPGVVLHFTPIEEKYSTDFYIAVIKNRQNTFQENLEKIYISPTKDPIIRGVGKQMYILAWDHKVKNLFSDKVSIEPYIVHCHAPDQSVEFPSDSSVYLTTLGIGVEGKYPRWSWGFEGALNFGDMNLKFWDRNRVQYVKDGSGNILAQYTKIYDENQTESSAKLVYVTTTNKDYVAGSPLDTDMNGQAIGPNLYNAYDRFRPEQRRKIDGYFFLGDFDVDIVPDHLKIGWGTGYASGTNHFHQDANKMSRHQCMNQTIGGFIPLQSEYIGTRIRHVVMFNQGVPRCNEVKINQGSTTNLILDIEAHTIQDMTNIAFVGTRVAWTPLALQKNKVTVSGNCIAYWAPVVTEHYIEKTKKLCTPSNFLGTELSFESTCVFWDKIVCNGYGGVLFPGGFYKDNRGHIITDNELPTGSDPGMVGGFTAAYAF